jgi:hypothetical protein
MTTNHIRNCRLAALTLATFLGLAGFAAAQFITTDRVLAFDTDIWTLWAPSGSSRVVVDGDGDTDLDCFVYDRFGRLLGLDDDGTDYCIVDFRQPTSGNVRVEIRNLGDVYNRYTLSLR